MTVAIQPKVAATQGICRRLPGHPTRPRIRFLIDREQVLHVARLARLELADEEVERMSGELTTILDHVERMNELWDAPGGSLYTRGFPRDTHRVMAQGEGHVRDSRGCRTPQVARHGA